MIVPGRERIPPLGAPKNCTECTRTSTHDGTVRCVSAVIVKLAGDVYEVVGFTAKSIMVLILLSPAWHKRI